MHLKSALAALLIASAHISLCTGSFFNVSLSLIAEAAGAPTTTEALMTPASDVLLCAAMTPSADDESSTEKTDDGRCNDPQGCLHSAQSVLHQTFGSVVLPSPSLAATPWATLGEECSPPLGAPLALHPESPPGTWSFERAKVLAKRE